MSAGLPLLLVCLATLESALFAEALWLFLVATVVGGVAVGFIFRGGLSELNRLADPGRRAAVVATFFVAAYLGLGLPAVLVGLISLAAGAVDASVYVSGLVAAIVVAASVVVLRSFGTISAPKPPSTPSDGWCCPEEPAAAGTQAARRAGNGAVTRWLSTLSAPGAAAAAADDAGVHLRRLAVHRLAQPTPAAPGAAGDGVQLAHVAPGKRPQNDPRMDGARIPPNTSVMAPCRRTSTSSMLSAPAAMPATSRGSSGTGSPRPGWRS